MAQRLMTAGTIFAWWHSALECRHTGEDRLNNTARHAETICERIRFRAAMLVDPKITDQIYKAVREQLVEPLSRKPPELVIIFLGWAWFSLKTKCFSYQQGQHVTMGMQPAAKIRVLRT
jgi:hypothetical protein